MPAPSIVVTLPGEGLEWAQATKHVPGSRIQSRIEGIALRRGRYRVTALVRATGFPTAVIEQTLAHLRARHGQGAVEVLEPPGSDGALVRTHLDVDALQSPYVPFLLRFHEDFQSLTATVDAGRFEVRGIPRPGTDVEEDARRIEGFVRKLGLGGSARVDNQPPLDDGLPPA